MWLFDTAPARHKIVSIQGQSNAFGLGARASISSLSDATLIDYDAVAFPRVFIFNPTTGDYENLIIGTNNQAYSAGENFGPEFGLAIRWTREVPRGNLYLDKQIGDGQPISYFESGGGFFSTMLSRRTTANTWLTDNNISAVNAGVAWVQGESNASDTQAYYEDALNSYMDSLVSSSPQILTSTSKQVIAQMAVGTSLYSTAIAAAKSAYVSDNSDVARLVTFANYMNGDNLHLNARGQVQLGYDIFEQMFNRSHLVI